jgi:hypothetical protein
MNEARNIIEQLTLSSYENALFLRNLWYFALHGDKSKKGRLPNQRNSRRKDRLWNVQIERTEHMAGRTEQSGEQRVGQNLIAPGNKMRS